MTIGIGIGIGLASRRPRAWTPAAAGASLLSWVRGDDPGAAINTTPEPHQYAAIPDRGTLGGQYEQATSANQPQVSTLWTPRPAPLFATDRALIHSAAASEFAALHNATDEATIAWIARPSTTGAQYCLTTSNSTGNAAVGFSAFFSGTSTITCTVQNGSGGTAPVFTAANIGAYVDTVHRFVFRKRPAASGQIEWSLHRNGLLLTSGTSTNAPSASAPAVPLRWGNTGFGVTGAQPELVAFTTWADVEQLETYLSRWSYTP